MGFDNSFTITVDTKRNIAIAKQVPTYIRNDTATLFVRIQQDGVEYDFSTADRYVFNFKRSDGVIVNGLGLYDPESNLIKYELKSTEMEKVGNVELMISLFLGESRITTRPFFIKILADYEDGIGSEEHLTLLQELFVEVETLKLTTEEAEFIRKQNEEHRQVNTAQAISRLDKLVQDTSYNELFDIDTDYEKNNIVSFNGSSYIAKQATKGNAPTEKNDDTCWGLLAEKGKDGVGSVSIKRKTFVATVNQTVFHLPFSYEPLSNKIRVIVGGVPQGENSYEETNETTITLSEGINSGTEVTVEVFSTEFDDRIAEYDSLVEGVVDAGEFAQTQGEFAKREADRLAGTDVGELHSIRLYMGMDEPSDTPFWLDLNE